MEIPISSHSIETGELVWKQFKHQTRSYCTPLIREVDGTDQLVLAVVSALLRSIQRMGNRFGTWRVNRTICGFHGLPVTFAVGGYPTHHVISVDPTGRGDVSETHVRWHETNVMLLCPIPIVVKNLIVADDAAQQMLRHKNGKRYWQSRMGRHHSGSLSKPVC